LVLHPLVLAAQALVILDRPEDARAEEAVAFGLERAVIDRFRLLDLAEAPRANLLGARDRNLDLIERRRRGLIAERRGDQAVVLLVHGVHVVAPSGVPAAPRANRDPGANSSADAGAPLSRRSKSSGHSAALAAFPSSSSTLRPSERISLTSTLKLSG